MSRRIATDSRSEAKIKALTVLLLFFLFLGIMAIYFGQIPWFTDENDNFVGGMTVVRGGDIYKDHISQHMPVMYYLCALFYMLGARSVIWYRFYFAVFSAALWTALYFRYHKHFGKITMVLGPVFYISFLGNGDFQHSTVLSDKLQAYGMAILLFEFLVFAKDYDVSKRLSLSSCCWISFAVFISFGSAFVAAFGIFAVFVSFVLVEFRGCIKSRIKLRRVIPMLAERYWRLVVITAIPFTVLLGWYLLTGNLSNFIYWAYTFNREIYSKYTGGFGSNASRVFLDCFALFWSTAVGAVNQIASNTFQSIFQLILLGTNIVFAFYWGQKDKLLGICTFFILILSVTRGYFIFHAAAHYMLSAYMLAFLIERLLGVSNTLAPSPKCFAQLSIMLVALFVAAPLFVDVGEIAGVKQLLDPVVSDHARLLQLLTDRDEPVGLLNGAEGSQENITLLVESDRLYISGGTVVPWIHEAIGQEHLDELKTIRPRVVLYNPDYQVWGSFIKDYAPETAQYVEENYTQISGPIWVRDDYAYEACNLLGIPVPKYLILENTTISGALPAMVETDDVRQYFIAAESILSEVWVAVGTYGQENHGELIVELHDAFSDTLLAEATADISQFADNTYCPIDFPETELSGTAQYYLSFHLDQESNEDLLSIYRTADGTSNETGYAVINGEIANYNLCVNLYGKKG